MPVSSWKVYLVLFMVLAAAYAWYALSRLRGRAPEPEPAPASPRAGLLGRVMERFSPVEPEEPRREGLGLDVAGPLTSAASAAAVSDALDRASDASGEEDDAYDRRMHVMRVFDTVLHRKPSEDELSRFSALPTEGGRLRAIVNAFDDLQQGPPAAATADPGPPYHPSLDQQLPSPSPSPSPANGDEILYPMTTMATGQAAAPGGEDGGGLRGGEPSRARVCIDRSELLGRLRRAQAELSQLAQLAILL